MQGELSRLYYEYYRFAFDTARSAEQTMKHELMRPELDATDFIQFNYWDGGRKGLLAGEALHLDLKRMEMAYHDHNKREYELTRHVSLRQLDPLALLTLKVDRHLRGHHARVAVRPRLPGHYMRRIKTVALSMPVRGGALHERQLHAVAAAQHGPRSRRCSGQRLRAGPANEDDRFVDYFGAVRSIVTSSGINDSGMFETNLRDERFLPFEGAGAISTWQLELPAEFRPFDYATISDVVLHVRYTAREGGDPMGSQSTKELQTMLAAAGQAPQYLMFCLRYDFPTEWSAFVNGTGAFAAALQKSFFPYSVQSAKVTVSKLTLYTQNPAGTSVSSLTPTVDLTALSANLNSASATDNLSLAGDAQVLVRSLSRQVFLMLQYSFKT